MPKLRPMVVLYHQKSGGGRKQGCQLFRGQRRQQAQTEHCDLAPSGCHGRLCLQRGGGDRPHTNNHGVLVHLADELGPVPTEVPVGELAPAFIQLHAVVPGAR